MSSVVGISGGAGTGICVASHAAICDSPRSRHPPPSHFVTASPMGRLPLSHHQCPLTVSGPGNA